MMRFFNVVSPIGLIHEPNNDKKTRPNGRKKTFERNYSELVTLCQTLASDISARNWISLVDLSSRSPTNVQSHLKKKTKLIFQIYEK